MHLELVFLHIHRFLPSQPCAVPCVYPSLGHIKALQDFVCGLRESPSIRKLVFPVLSRAKWRGDCRIKAPAPIFHLQALLLALQKQFVPILRSCVARIMIQLHSRRIRFQQLPHLKSGWRGDNLEGFVWRQRKGKINTQETQK